MVSRACWRWPPVAGGTRIARTHTRTDTRAHTTCTRHASRWANKERGFKRRAARRRLEASGDWRPAAACQACLFYRPTKRLRTDANDETTMTITTRLTTRRQNQTEEINETVKKRNENTGRRDCCCQDQMRTDCAVHARPPRVEMGTSTENKKKRKRKQKNTHALNKTKPIREAATENERNAGDDGRIASIRRALLFFHSAFPFNRRSRYSLARSGGFRAGGASRHKTNTPARRSCSERTRTASKQ